LYSPSGSSVFNAPARDWPRGLTLNAELNWQVLSVTFALSVFTGLLFGLAPAIQATRVDVMPALKEVRGARVSYGIRPTLSRVSLTHILMGAQIVFSLVMLVGAGLLARTLFELTLDPARIQPREHIAV